MNAKNAYTECVRRTGQRGVSMGTFPGWHVLGTGIGRNDTTALVKSDADARLYAAAPALLDMLEQILEHPDARIPCRTEAEAHALLRLARGS